MTNIFAIDFGAGNLKVYGSQGGIMIASQIATVAGETLSKTIGLRTSRPPLKIRLNGHAFYVGADAHDWGRPIEDLNDSRFASGAPGLRAILYGAVTQYAQTYGLIELLSEPLNVIVGLTQSSLSGETAKATANSVKHWLTDLHRWHANGSPWELEIAKAEVTSQAAGALFDYLLDDHGEFIPRRKSHFKQEIGIVLGRFNGKGHLPDQPVMAVARGLHKMAVMRQRRYSH